MKKSESYSGPWPRKRHSHTCVSCKRDRDQGAVACYKSKCTLPQRIDSCECCQAAALDDDGGRTLVGNTPTCEDCGESQDHCTCGEGCPVCGCEPCSCEQPCAGCGKVECSCNAIKVAADRLQSDFESKSKKDGDIQRSYSADLIGSAKSTIRAPFKHEGLLWCTVSLGPGARASAYVLTPADHFKGKKTSYNSKVVKDNGESARADRMGFHHGMAVKHGRDTYVLTGPPVIFIAAAVAEQVGEPATVESIPTPAYPATIKEREYHSIPAVPLLGVQLDLFGGAQ